ncbi:MAG TPA: DUF4382 domain-containing protein [Nitrospirota bacterium]|nr:DUF4382 domain-containing protein [Nitrospirota bacterium]
MTIRKTLFWLLIGSLAVLTSAVLLYSCSGGGGGSAGGTPFGAVGVYLTNDTLSTQDTGTDTSSISQLTDTIMSLFSQVTGTIEKVQLISTGTGTTCDVLNGPTAVNIADLANVLQLVNVTQCPAGPYNRIHIEFDKSVDLMSAPTGTPVSCSFVSYKDEGNHDKPNVLQCDPASNICTLDINGAVNVLANQQNKLALDFNLKDFDVFFGESGCAVTMKVSPLYTEEIEARRHPEAVTGIVSQLSTTNQTFDLTDRHRTYNVLYSGITTTDQPGINSLLQRAQDDQLKAKVKSSSVDFMNNMIDASAILVKVEGTVSNLVSNATFSLNYGPGGTKNINVDYSKATVEGTVTNGSWVDVKLYGYSSASNDFLANQVEVECDGTTTED